MLGSSVQTSLYCSQANIVWTVALESSNVFVPRLKCLDCSVVELQCPYCFKAEVVWLVVLYNHIVYRFQTDVARTVAWQRPSSMVPGLT